MRNRTTPRALAAAVAALLLGTATLSAQSEAERLNEQARALLESNPGKSRELAMQAYDLQKEGPADDAELSNTLNYIGLSYYNERNYGEAIKYFQQALRAALRTPAKDKTANLFQKIGKAYVDARDFKRAVFYYQQALRVYQQLGYDDYAAKTYYDLGVVLYMANDYSASVDALDNAVGYYDKMWNIRGAGNAYVQLGLTYQKAGNQKKAIESLQKAIEKFRMLGDNSQMAFASSHLGSVYARVKLYDNALQAHRQTLGFCGDDLPELRARSMHDLGRIALEQQRYPEAADLLGQALALADSLRVRYLMTDVYKSLYELASAQDDSHRALHFHQKYTAMVEESAAMAVEAEIAARTAAAEALADPSFDQLADSAPAAEPAAKPAAELPRVKGANSEETEFVWGALALVSMLGNVVLGALLLRQRRREKRR